MPSNVRVSRIGDSNAHDSHAQGRARLKLKLAAIGYVNSRHGIDADVALLRGARALLHATAFDYYEALLGVTLHKRPADPAQRDDVKLFIAAIAYGNARHGVDADAGLARVGLALLCSASIEYCEGLTSADPRKRPVDPHVQLDNGA